MSTERVELDGSFGEGGGQILRTSLALALFTGKRFHLRNVRAGRPKPGLQPQHLMSVRTAETIGHASVRGASKGSSDLVFEPGEVAPGRYQFDIGTAGATALVLHTLYLPLMVGRADPSEITLIGGTHTTTSPCFHFLDTTWRSYLEHFGFRLRLELERPGFYPRGGGVVKAYLQPCAQVNGFRLDASTPRPAVRITGFSAVAGLPDHVARRQARRAVYRLEEAGLEAALKEETWEGGPGSVLALILDTQPAPALFFGLGARGKPAEEVADEAVDQVLSHLSRCEHPAVDCHSADQILLPLALAEGPSEYAVAEVTQHLLTNIAVIRQFLERDITCTGDEGQAGVVHIR